MLISMASQSTMNNQSAFDEKKRACRRHVPLLLVRITVCIERHIPSLSHDRSSEDVTIDEASAVVSGLASLTTWFCCVVQSGPVQFSGRASSEFMVHRAAEDT